MFVRSMYNYDADKASEEAGIEFTEPTLTKQSMAEEADINTIVRRFGLTGQVPVSVRAPTYGDFDGVSDYREALMVVKEADASFMKMPADVRARFDNDPALFVEFCSDVRNLEEMRKLGLAVPAPVPDPEPPVG